MAPSLALSCWALLFSAHAYTFLMNGVISDLDGLTSDDIRGVRVLYPAEVPTIVVQPQTQAATAGGHNHCFGGSDRLAAGELPMAPFRN